MLRSFLAVTLLVLLALPFSVAAQVCSSTDQDLMNSCVSDGISTCHGTYSSCVREVEEASNVYGRFLEKCCCSGGEPRTEAEFLSCKSAVKKSYKNAKTFRGILSSDFKAGFYDKLKVATFDDCTFGCDF